MNIGNLIGVSLGVKLINGKIKPKKSKLSKKIGILFLVILFILFVVLFAFGILNFNIEFIFSSCVGMISFGYLFLISPYTQNSNNYYIEFKRENTIDGFNLFYKGKLVDIKYKIDNNGKFAFFDNANKLGCISYADATKMSDFTKYKIINYFALWLLDNDLMSSEVTISLEKL